jgi:hypothetical protein
MILLLAAASLADLAVNVGLVSATGVFLQSVVTFACHMQALKERARQDSNLRPSLFVV